MNELKEKMKLLCQRLEKALEVLRLEDERKELKQLEAKSTTPDFWSNQETAQETMQKISLLTSHIGAWDRITADINNLTEIVESLDESDHDLFKEAKKKEIDLSSRLEKLEFELLFSGPYDKNNAIVSISAGSGGTDAQDWAEILYRMYSRFAEKNRLVLKILDQTKGEEAGLKSISFELGGPYAYGKLKSEHGVHRLVRLSPYDADKARHTSFALVEALPEIEEEAFSLDEKELRIDVFRASGHGGQSVNTTDSAVRVTHVPTGISAVSQNERSQLQNKENAIKVLKSKLVLLAEKQKAKELSEIKGEPISAEWGNQIRSYVLHPYNLVKDTRTQIETTDAQNVLDGDINAFIEAYLQKIASENK